MHKEREGARLELFVITGKIWTLHDDTNVLGAFIFKHINTKLQQALSYLKYGNLTHFDEVALQPVSGRQCGKVTTKEGREIELQIFLEVESPTRNQGELGFDITVSVSHF